MKKILYTLLLASTVFVSCDDRLDELNTDKKNPSTFPPEALFASATREVVDNIVSMSVNDNPFRLYSQMWAQTTYPDESQYTMTAREIPLNIYTNQYRDVLIDLQDAKTGIQAQLDDPTNVIPEQTLRNQMAVIDILMGYTYITLVDIFGDIPYSEALDPDNLDPVYDDARTIYNSVEDILTTSSTLLSANTAAGGFGTSDLVYGGDVDAWATFANSIKLRMAMKLADVDAATSITWADEAMAAGVISSNAQNFSMTYQGSSPNSSPLHEDLVLSGRADFVAANTLVDAMNTRLDPRLMTYTRNPISYGWNVDDNGMAQDSTFTSNMIVNLDGVANYMTAPFTLAAADSATIGAVTMFKGGTYGDANAYSTNSQVGDILHTPAYPGTLYNAAETHFLMAEMIERGGYAVAGTAEAHYNAAITASFDQWGVSGVATYLARPEVAYTTADGGSGDWRQIIGTQMWLGLYNQGLEGWSTWRRLDFDGFTPPPGMTMADIPNRMTYPLREATLNGTSLAAAQAKLTGGDEVSSKIFWDVN
jgi:hypothetical protein